MTETDKRLYDKTYIHKLSRVLGDNDVESLKLREQAMYPHKWYYHIGKDMDGNHVLQNPTTGFTHVVKYITPYDESVEQTIYDDGE